jgi:uncharacterized protein YbjT (DUF2867 family)
MSSIKNVVLAGASGNLGPSILTALINAGTFNITVFKRIGSKSTFPSSVAVEEVDYTSLSSLTTALTGADALISTLAAEAFPLQDVLVDAAIAAGVQRFLPSEFGSDISNPNTQQLPVFAAKVKLNAYLAEKAKTSSLTYTLVRNSGFLDWGVKVGFLIDSKSGSPHIYDGGNKPFSVTTLATVGEAVVGVLNHPEETKNRAVYIQDAVLTQNQLLEIVKKVTPGSEKWTPVPVSTEEAVKVSYERLAKHLYDAETFVPFILRSIFAEEYGGEFKNLDNELLGLKGKTDAEVEAIVKSALGL